MLFLESLNSLYGQREPGDQVHSGRQEGFPPSEAQMLPYLCGWSWVFTGSGKLLQKWAFPSKGSIHHRLCSSEWEEVLFNLNLCWWGWTAILNKYHSRDESHYSQWSTPHISNLGRVGSCLLILHRALQVPLRPFVTAIFCSPSSWRVWKSVRGLVPCKLRAEIVTKVGRLHKK